MSSGLQNRSWFLVCSLFLAVPAAFSLCAHLAERGRSGASSCQGASPTGPEPHPFDLEHIIGPISKYSHSGGLSLSGSYFLFHFFFCSLFSSLLFFLSCSQYSLVLPSSFLCFNLLIALSFYSFFSLFCFSHLNKFR